MHFSSLLSSLLSLTTLITVVVGLPARSENAAKTDIEGILTVLSRVSTGIVRVDAEVKLWLGDMEGATRILEGARWVHQDMSTGAQYIEKLPNGTISTFDSLKIANPMSSIMKATDSYTKGLLNKKSAIEGLSLKGQFLTSLQESKLAAHNLATAITMKLPATMAWTVSPVAEVVITALDKTAQSFGALPGPYISQIPKQLL